MSISDADSLPLDFAFVRPMRKERGLTLDAVAVPSGLSIALPSKLERNHSRDMEMMILHIQKPHRF